MRMRRRDDDERKANKYRKRNKMMRKQELNECVYKRDMHTERERMRNKWQNDGPISARVNEMNMKDNDHISVKYVCT